MKFKKILSLSLTGLLVIITVLAAAYWYFYQGITEKVSVIENIDAVRKTSGLEENDQKVIILPGEENASEKSDIQNDKDDVKMEGSAEGKESEVMSVSDIEITPKHVEWGHQSSSNRSIDTIVIHSSYDGLGKDPYSVSGIIKEYQQYKVAPHYLIDREGKIYQMVKDSDVAYHAGVSKMPDGRTNANDFSIGIELMNTKKDSYTQEQYSSLKRLVAHIKSKYVIKNLVGHDQIASGRKDDPWNFDWKKLQ